MKYDREAKAFAREFVDSPNRPATAAALGAFLRRVLSPCDACPRAEKHTHCPECGSLEHGAAYCETLG